MPFSYWSLERSSSLGFSHTFPFLITTPAVSPEGRLSTSQTTASSRQGATPAPCPTVSGLRLHLCRLLDFTLA